MQPHFHEKQTNNDVPSTEETLAAVGSERLSELLQFVVKTAKERAVSSGSVSESEITFTDRPQHSEIYSFYNNGVPYILAEGSLPYTGGTPTRPRIIGWHANDAQNFMFIRADTGAGFRFTQGNIHNDRSSIDPAMLAETMGAMVPPVRAEDDIPISLIKGRDPSNTILSYADKDTLNRYMIISGMLIDPNKTDMFTLKFANNEEFVDFLKHDDLWMASRFGNVIIDSSDQNSTNESIDIALSWPRFREVYKLVAADQIDNQLFEEIVKSINILELKDLDTNISAILETHPEADRRRVSDEAKRKMETASYQLKGLVEELKFENSPRIKIVAPNVLALLPTDSLIEAIRSSARTDFEQYQYAVIFSKTLMTVVEQARRPLGISPDNPPDKQAQELISKWPNADVIGLTDIKESLNYEKGSMALRIETPEDRQALEELANLSLFEFADLARNFSIHGGQELTAEELTRLKSYNLSPAAIDVIEKMSLTKIARQGMSLKEEAIRSKAEILRS